MKILSSLLKEDLVFNLEFAKCNFKDYLYMVKNNKWYEQLDNYIITKIVPPIISTKILFQFQ